MNAAFRTTLLMGVLAAVSAFFAFSFYPWPRETVIDEKVNQSLFEDYETNSVREISIVKFDQDKSNIEQLILRRKGEQWVLPRFNNFVATGDSRIAEAAKSLIGRTVFEKTSDDQLSHVDYGVIDPSEVGPATSRSSLGTKVVLKDRNQKELAALIIGNQEKNDRTGQRHYVRIAGQPTVYTIDIEKRIFETEFGGWIDPNLMQVPIRESEEIRVSRIKIDSYRLATDDLSKQDPKYRATFLVDKPPIKLMFESADGKGGLEKIAAPAKETTQAMTKGFSFLTQLQYKAVIRKPKALASKLKKADVQSSAADFAELNELGIVFKSASAENGFDFDSAGGEVSVVTSDGVAVDMLIGNFASKSATQNIGISYNVMMIARVLADVLPVPEKPEGAEEDSAENKGYLREVAERERKLKSAALRVNELNQAYADWIYIMPEETVNRLRPELALETSSTPKKLPPGLGPVPAADTSATDADDK